MDPTCHVSTVHADGGGVMVFGMVSWHTLGPKYIPINYHVLFEHCCWLCTALHGHNLPSSGYFQHDNTLCHKAKAISSANMWVFIQLLECDITEDSQHKCVREKRIVWRKHVNMDQNFRISSAFAIYARNIEAVLRAKKNYPVLEHSSWKFSVIIYYIMIS